jgi:hypothetical protein
MSVLGGPPRYLLPFDHRASFKSGLLGITGEPVETQRRPVSDLKSIICEGFTQALAEGAPRASCGGLGCLS